MRKPVRPGIKERISALFGSERFCDAAKNTLIAVLVLSASLLLVRLGMFSFKGSGPTSAQGGQGASQQTAQGSGTLRAAGPYTIVVTGESGSHCALMYDGTELKQAYDRLSAYLGEALGSAGDPESVSEKEWYAALKKSGVYFNFGYSQPLSVIASSLGTTMTSTSLNHSAARFCIAAEGDDVALYYLRGRDGRYYKCATAISSAALKPKLGDWSSNGASFLFETDYNYDLVDSCFTVIEGQAQIHGVTAQNPIGGDYDKAGLAGVFGMNSYMANHYTEDDGTEVYVEGARILRVYTDGRVSFKNSAEPAEAQESETGFAAALSTAEKAVSATVGAHGGIASTVLTYIGYDAEASSYTVRFEYEINNCPVITGAVGAAQFTVSGGVITAGELYFRKYAYSGEDDSPLPAVQAMAVVQASGGGTPFLGYVDDGDNVLAGWTILN